MRRPLGQELDPDILDHPNGGAAQPLRLLGVKSGDRAAILPDRERQHLAIGGDAPPRDPGLDEARIACARPAPEKPPTLEPRHQTAHGRLRHHGGIGKLRQGDPVMGGEHREHAPLLERIAAPAQPLAQVLVEPRHQAIHQIGQEVVEADGTGHHRLSTAGSQVAIAGNRKIRTRIRMLIAM